MKFFCLGYFDETQWEAMPDTDRNVLMDACLAYDDTLRQKGHILGGEALQSPKTATTLRYRNGRVTVTDGPFAETKEQLGGILIIEASDTKEAIQLLSKHPGVKIGPFEIRAVEDMTAVLRESEARRRSAAANPAA